MTEIQHDNATPENIDQIKSLMKGMGIEINGAKRSSASMFKLQTSHKKATLLDGPVGNVLNFNFLTFNNGKIETRYSVSEIIQKVIDCGNQYVDFFEALRIIDLENNEMHSYADSVRAYIDFEFDFNNTDNHEIVLNFAHNKTNMSNVISNQSVICSGTHNSMYIVFDFKGNMTVNRVNVARKRTLEAWDNAIESNFKEYGMLTEMVKI